MLTMECFQFCVCNLKRVRIIVCGGFVKKKIEIDISASLKPVNLLPLQREEMSTAPAAISADPTADATETATSENEIVVGRQ